MDKKGLDLSETVWTRLDRKAGAIVELTMRQLRHRISTWVVLGGDPHPSPREICPEKQEKPKNQEITPYRVH